MSSLLGSLKNRLREIFNAHESICLWFSGGADSRLLLEAMLELKKPFGILRFDDGWSREQRRLIDEIVIKHDLQVFSYPPITYSMIGEGENLSLVAEYAIDNQGNSLPVVRDIVAGTECAFDLRLEVAPLPFAPLEFAAHVRGQRFDDWHWSLKKVLTAERATLNGKTFYAPLAEWRRNDVIENLRSSGVDYIEPPDALNTGNVAACSVCLRGERVFCPKRLEEIEPHDWNAAENLAAFRARYE